MSDKQDTVVQQQTRICPVLSEFHFKAMSDMPLYTTNDRNTHFCYTQHFNIDTGVVITSYVLYSECAISNLDKTGYVSAYHKILKAYSHKTIIPFVTVCFILHSFLTCTLFHEKVPPLIISIAGLFM